MLDVIELPEIKDGKDLIDFFLEEQHNLTAVEDFSQKHATSTLPGMNKFYKNLIPLSKPKPGEQYAFEVNLDACTGCKACVSACHTLNGLDKTETWRDTGTIHSSASEIPFQQTITSSCHHCVDPACMTGCPVIAYEKDEVTGIVRHLDDQCIGCQYCILKCPYDAPKYNADKGIVRKCDMCQQRLGDGEAPACVQACPSEAISIKVVEKEILEKRVEVEDFLPGAPSPKHTSPTTTYITNKALPEDTKASDQEELSPEHAHFPLVFMLVITQLAAGAFILLPFISQMTAITFDRQALKLPILMAAIIGFGGLHISLLHLGRPLFAFRAFLGFRTSWLSREIIAFGGFGGAVCFYAFWVWREDIAVNTGMAFMNMPIPYLKDWHLGFGAALASFSAIFCSVMVYADTPREFWAFRKTAPKFFLSSFILGAALCLVGFSFSIEFGFMDNTASATTAYKSLIYNLSIFLIVALSVKIFLEGQIYSHLKDTKFSSLKGTAILLNGDLRPFASVRVAISVLGGILLPVSLLLIDIDKNMDLIPFFTAVILVLLLIGELLERYLFFTAVVAPKMPRGIS